MTRDGDEKRQGHYRFRGSLGDWGGGLGGVMAGVGGHGWLAGVGNVVCVFAGVKSWLPDLCAV